MCEALDQMIKAGEKRGEIRGEIRGERRGRQQERRSMILNIVRGFYAELAPAGYTEEACCSMFRISRNEWDYAVKALEADA